MMKGYIVGRQQHRLLSHLFCLQMSNECCHLISSPLFTVPLQKDDPKICFGRVKLQVANKIQNESLNTYGDTFLKFNLDSIVTSCYLYLCCESKGGISETGQCVFLSPCGFYLVKKIKSCRRGCFLSLLAGGPLENLYCGLRGVSAVNGMAWAFWPGLSLLSHT